VHGVEYKEIDVMYVYILYESSWPRLGKNLHIPESRSEMKFYPYWLSHSTMMDKLQDKIKNNYSKLSYSAGNL
jgi:hypothetical protein